MEKFKLKDMYMSCTSPLFCNRKVWESAPGRLAGDDMMSADVVPSPATPHRGALKADPDPVEHQ